jgi:hypothetical protein
MPQGNEKQEKEGRKERRKEGCLLFWQSGVRRNNEARIDKRERERGKRPIPRMRRFAGTARLCRRRIRRRRKKDNVLSLFRRVFSGERIRQQATEDLTGIWTVVSLGLYPLCLWMDHACGGGRERG